MLWVIVILIVVILILVGGRGCDFSPTIVESTPDYADYDDYPDMDASAEYEPADTYGETEYDDPDYYRDPPPRPTRQADPALSASPALPQADRDEVDTVYVVDNTATSTPRRATSAPTTRTPTTYDNSATPPPPPPATTPPSAATTTAPPPQRIAPPAPTRAPARPRNDGYTGKHYVIVGSYRYESNAFEEVERWQRAGYTAQVLQFHGTSLYRVSLGTYDDARQADTYVRTLEQRGVEAYVRRQ